MIEIKNPLTFNFDNVEIDPFWNVGSEREHKNHHIHAYPAKFPAFITQKAIQFAIAEGVNIEKIADIFCGCGTVAFEAKRLGYDFWGCDLNPTAVLIAKAKSNLYKSETIEKYLNQIISVFDESINAYATPKKINERIKYWFYDKEIKDLSLLKECINKIVPKHSKYIYFFLCAFSNILKPTSKWLTKSIKPQIDPKKTPLDVRQAFVEQCKFMKIAIIEEYHHSKVSKTEIKKQNALKIRKQNFIDLIVTSPPYVTSYEYADLHQLSTLWLDYSDDYRDLRKDSIGSNHNVKNSNYNKLNNSGKMIVTELNKVDKLKARAVTKYYCDMQLIACVCKNTLKENGMALFVMGNTEYKGVHINNAMHLVESLYDSGFNHVHITKRKITSKLLTPYRDEKGRFTTDDSTRKIYSEEFIIVGR